jgi:ribosomal protein S18 acetylase RimI-like enzyme
MMLSTCIVEQTSDLEQIYRLRYAVYIAELGNQHPLADHTRQTLRDRLDDASPVIVGVFADGCVVGTLRINRIMDCPRDALAYHQIPEALFAEGDRHLVVTMLIVAPEHRSSPAIFHLCRKATQFYLESGASSFRLYAEPHNLALYERMGFSVDWERPMDHPLYRKVYPAALRLQDRSTGQAFERRVMRAARTDFSHTAVRRAAIPGRSEPLSS